MIIFRKIVFSKLVSPSNRDTDFEKMLKKKSFQKVVQNRTPEPTVTTPELSKMAGPKMVVTKTDGQTKVLLNSVETTFCTRCFCPVVKIAKNPN